MRRGLELLHEGEAQAFVSAGNTGALVGLSHYVIGMLPGLERPALQATIPSVKGHTHVLDLGGNVDCSAELLVQFAAMGLVLAQELDANQNPRVGLLNVGAEAIKGSAQVQAADVLLRDSSLASSYIGFVEGDDIYLGDVDIVVCDGFAGNILLKASEGGARMFSHFLMREFKASLLRRAVLAISAPLLRSFRRRMDPRRYNGASLLGLREIVIKSHGGPIRWRLHMPSGVPAMKSITSSRNASTDRSATCCRCPVRSGEVAGERRRHRGNRLLPATAGDDQ